MNLAHQHNTRREEDETIVKKTASVAVLILVLLQAVLGVFMLVGARHAHAAGTEYVEGKFVSVYDGDTIVFKVSAFPNSSKLNRLKLRIPGIDTPEYGKKAQCPTEAKKAEAAKLFLEETLGSITTLRIENPRWDKYGGRIEGDLVIKGKTLTDILIDSGHAVAYDGEGARRNWCSTR
jgi:endonuclease YncB( thermonuclease family)